MEGRSVSPRAVTDFKGAVESLLNGAKMRRIAWGEDGSYVVVQDNELRLFNAKNNSFHSLIVSVGDMTGTDWIVC